MNDIGNPVLVLENLQCGLGQKREAKSELSLI
jgi:hypothetical protein